MTKAPINAVSGIIQLNEAIPLIDGSSLEAGEYYWATGQDVGKQTTQIQFADGKTYDVPTDKVFFLKGNLNKQLKTIELKPVGN